MLLLIYNEYSLPTTTGGNLPKGVTKGEKERSDVAGGDNCKKRFGELRYYDIITRTYCKKTRAADGCPRNVYRIRRRLLLDVLLLTVDDVDTRSCRSSDATSEEVVCTLHNSLLCLYLGKVDVSNIVLSLHDIP